MVLPPGKVATLIQRIMFVPSPLHPPLIYLLYFAMKEGNEQSKARSEVVHNRLVRSRLTLC